MSPRALRTLPVVLLVVLALVLGSVSTASAVSLTKGAVKKIAAKVVKKQAPSLTVAHADTATTATTASDAGRVGGLTGTQLGVRPIVFTIPPGTYPSGKVFQLRGVPAGDYLLGFHTIISTTAATFAECYLDNVTQLDYPLDAYIAAPTGHIPVLSATGYAHINAGDTLEFVCSTAANWSHPYPMHVTFTPAAGVINGTVVPSRGTEDRAPSR